MGKFSLENLFGMTIRESANDGSDFTNPDADYRRLFLGEDGQLHVKDSAGSVTDIGGIVTEITDLPTADTTTTNVLAPDGAGGVEWRAEAASGLAPGQTVSYPSTFTGDTINGSSTTPFVDVAAFDTKEVLNSRVLHLQTKGASKDHKVRVTLGTTKAAAFDVRVALAFAGLPWSGADNNTYADLMLTTAAGAAQIAVCRLQTWPMDSTMSTPTIYVPMIQTKFGGSAVAAQADNYAPMVQFGQVVTVRFVRDGSNVIKFYSAPGVAPLALPNVRIRSNYEPYTQTVSGTLACIEFAIHTPSGPGAAVEYDLWVDYLQSV